MATIFQWQQSSDGNKSSNGSKNSNGNKSFNGNKSSNGNKNSNGNKSSNGNQKISRGFGFIWNMGLFIVDYDYLAIPKEFLYNLFWI